MSQDGSSNTGGKATSFFEAARDVVIIGTVYAFFTGFSYVYYLYAHFGIPVSLLDLPFNQFPVYAYTVATAHGWVAPRWTPKTGH